MFRSARKARSVHGRAVSELDIYYTEGVGFNSRTFSEKKNPISTLIKWDAAVVVGTAARHTHFSLWDTFFGA